MPIKAQEYAYGWPIEEVPRPAAELVDSVTDCLVRSLEDDLASARQQNHDLTNKLITLEAALEAQSLPQEMTLQILSTELRSAESSADAAQGHSAQAASWLLRTYVSPAEVEVAVQRARDEGATQLEQAHRAAATDLLRAQEKVREEVRVVLQQAACDIQQAKSDAYDAQHAAEARAAEEALGVQLVQEEAAAEVRQMGEKLAQLQAAITQLQCNSMEKLISRQQRPNTPKPPLVTPSKLQATSSDSSRTTFSSSLDARLSCPLQTGEKLQATSNDSSRTTFSSYVEARRSLDQVPHRAPLLRKVLGS